MKQLTLGETAAVEDIAGQPITDLNNPAARKGKLMAALVVVVKKRTDPGFTLADALELPADEAGELIAEAMGGSPDPLG